MRSAYPHKAGFQANATGDTSEEGAAFITPHVAGMAAEIIGVLQAGARSPEEITSQMAVGGRRVLLTTVRARCTQLSRLGLVCDSGERGIGESGKVRVIRWALTSPAYRQAFAADRAREGRP